VDLSKFSITLKQPKLLHWNLLKVLCLVACLSGAQMSSARTHDNIPDQVYPGTTRPYQLPYPVGRAQPPGSPIPPPGEEHFFPIREDGQMFMLNVPIETNLTDRLNRFYFDPGWRGEVWTPFDTMTVAERQVYSMGTWKDYNEFSHLRKFNRFHYTMERWTGYGP